MTILHWLVEIYECQASPERIDVDALEDGVLELRERVQDCWDDYQQPGSASSEEDRAALLAMAELLSGIADSVEQFLASCLFHDLQEAIQNARELLDLRDVIRQRVEQLEPVLTDDSWPESAIG